MYAYVLSTALTRSRAVVLVWLCGLLASGLAALAEPGNISNGGFTVPGSAAAHAEELARRYIPSRPGTAVIVALNSRSEADIAAAVNPLRQLQHVYAVEQAESGLLHIARGEQEALAVYFVRIDLAYPAAERLIPTIGEALSKSAGRHVAFALLGEAALAYYDSTIIREDLRRAELVALPVTLCILLVAFLSIVAACLPVILAAVALVYTLATVQMISLIAGLSVFVVTAASAIALGLSVDYSLIVVTRVREERRAGSCVAQAIERAMHTAGRAVVLSGVTVATLLSALIIVNVGLFTSVALGGIIATLTAVAAATTLLPATLALLGDRIDWLSFKPAVEASHRGTFWRRLAATVTAHPLIVALVSISALLVLATPTLALRLDFAPAAVVPPGSAIARETRDVAIALGSGATGLTQVITNKAEYAREVVTDNPNERAIWSVIHGIDKWSEMYVALKTAPSSEASHQTVMRLREEFSGLPIAVGGATADEMDLARRVLTRMPVVVGVAMVVLLLSLFLGFKSVLIPLKAVICSALSVAATLGALRLCFPSRTGVPFFLPIVAFALVLGLSIDYEVFLLSRIRELVHGGHATAAATSLGLMRSARPITLAGLAVTTVFAAFSFSSLQAVRELGVAVTIGVLLDVTIVRWALSPACVVLAGRWNWWFPGHRRKQHG